MDAERARRALAEFVAALELPAGEVEPARCADSMVRAFQDDFLRGYACDPAEYLSVEFEGAGDDLVLLRDIPFVSMCSHHLLPFFGIAHVAYLPNGKLTGLSSIARLVDGFACRLQNQERLARSVASALMERLADQGNGHYAYVDSIEEARRIFQQNLDSTLETVARDAKAQVEFDPRAVERYRLMGYENRDIADRQFRDDRVDAGEIGAGHRVTALYEVRLREEARASHPLLVFRVRYRDADSSQIAEIRRTLTVGDLADSWWEASRDLRLAAVAGSFAERLSLIHISEPTRPY